MSMSNAYGFSGSVTSVTAAQKIIDATKSYGLHWFRYSVSPGSSSKEYRKDIVQKFLDNGITVIVDMNHRWIKLDPSGQWYDNNEQVVKQRLLQVAQDFPDNDMVLLEPTNEDPRSNYYDYLARVVQWLRDRGITNKIVSNKWKLNWRKGAEDYGGMHFYFNSWSLPGASMQNNYAEGRDITCIHTEVGAHYKEWENFTASQVQAVNDFMTDCHSRGFGVMVWLNKDGANLARYAQLGLKFPTVSPGPSPPEIPEETITIPFTGELVVQRSDWKW